MRLLLVGLGRWGEKHLRVLAELGVDLWAADVSAERRGWAVAAGVPGNRVVADPAAALPHVDAVDVVTPADSHLALVRAALVAGRDCFVEKPVTQTVAEARELEALARDSGRVLQVGHIFRFHPVTDALRERLPTIGAVRYAAGRFAGFKRPRADVGVTQTDAIHYYDLFGALLAVPPLAVTATLRDHLGRGLDDWSLSTVEYGMVPVVVEAGYFAPDTARDCVIVGHRATLVADFGTGEVRVHENHHVHAPGGWQAAEGPVETLKASGPEPLRRELEAFLAAVAGLTPVTVDVGAGLTALRVVEAAQRSSALGRRVLLDEMG